MTSFRHLGILNGNDIVMQMAECSFDVHTKECLGTFMLGGSLVLLHGEGHMDLDYLSTTLQQRNVTFFSVVPSLMIILCDYLIGIRKFCRLTSIRSLGFLGMYTQTSLSFLELGRCQSFSYLLLGEPIVPKTLGIIATHLDLSSVNLYNLYGPAECTLTSVFHRITTDDIQRQKIPIGRPFPNMQAKILDAFFQPVIPGSEGILFLDGIQRFPGYFARNDLTNEVIYESQYNTNDLVRLDHNGLLHYVGRKDHQVKLHGQRIELSEIERCLLNTSISACVVIKWGDDHLIAYVQSHDINVEELREHCRSHLPSFMIPSMFIVVEQFPLNANGKLDRNKLPPPTFSSLTTTTVAESDPPHSQMEEWVHDLWCQILQHDGGHIPITASLFSVGGHSLLLIQLYHRYQLSFGFDHQTLTIGPFLRQATIAQHAQLLQTIQPIEKDLNRWPSLHMIQGNLCFETRICIPVVLY
jgi:acyl-CoA synthetase (AMP-forming)/AMP-acid ligase II